MIVVAYPVTVAHDLTDELQALLAEGDEIIRLECATASAAVNGTRSVFPVLTTAIEQMARVGKVRGA